MSDQPTTTLVAHFPINPDLVWDYDISPEGERTEAFNRWCLAQVLRRGTADDLSRIGLHTIHKYFPSPNLPREIYRFWHWYFNLPEFKQRYGSTHILPTSGDLGNQR